MNHFLLSRRGSLRLAAGASLAMLSPWTRAHGAKDSNGQTQLNIAGYSYDRVRAIQDGRLTLDGYRTKFHPEGIYRLNKLMYGPERPYEVSETGLIPYITKFANEEFRAYTLIPVFISRTFRHRNIFVRTDRGIDKPQDLRGKRVATPGYGMSSHTWIRGFLQDVYGLKPEDMHWIETTESSDGGQWHSNYKKYSLPEDFPIEKGPAGVDESEMIINGDVDALITAIEPKAYKDRHPKVRRLFADVQQAEKDYFAKTGVFPIMHAIAIREDVAEAHPQLPAALFRLYSDAKDIAYKDLETTGALKVTLPWAYQEMEATKALMGDNYWPYGITANRKELELAMRYTHEQGLAKRRLSVEEVFHPATLELSE